MGDKDKWDSEKDELVGLISAGERSLIVAAARGV